tara:strand:- start:283 stop:846 length:564 start_codon:yes stop_codon:yes gene_type:complete
LTNRVLKSDPIQTIQSGGGTQILMDLNRRKIESPILLFYKNLSIRFHLLQTLPRLTVATLHLFPDPTPQDPYILANSEHASRAAVISITVPQWMGGIQLWSTQAHISVDPTTPIRSIAMQAALLSTDTDPLDLNRLKTNEVWLQLFLSQQLLTPLQFQLQGGQDRIQGFTLSAMHSEGQKSQAEKDN